jgi:hypothetical protein
MLPDGLAVAADFPRDDADAQPLLPQIVDQDDLPQSLHLHAPRLVIGGITPVNRGAANSGSIEVRKSPTPLAPGELSNGALGEVTGGGYTRD